MGNINKQKFMGIFEYDVWVPVPVPVLVFVRGSWGSVSRFRFGFTALFTPITLNIKKVYFFFDKYIIHSNLEMHFYAPIKLCATENSKV